MVRFNHIHFILEQFNEHEEPCFTKTFHF